MKRTHIVVHHSLTADSGTVSWAAIERHHIETQGWNDIGYHAGIEIVASSKFGRFAYQALLGRPEDQVAAACKEGDMNDVGLHVCCVGNFDLAPPSLEMITRLVQRVIGPWMRRYSIPPERIVGHRDFATYKSCPGMRFDLDVIRRAVT